MTLTILIWLIINQISVVTIDRFSANIAEWAALKDKIREFNATLEASGIGYRINDKGQFEKEWNVGGIYAYADNYFAILRLRQCFKCNLPKKDVLSYLVLTRVIRKK